METIGPKRSVATARLVFGGSTDVVEAAGSFQSEPTTGEMILQCFGAIGATILVVRDRKIGRAAAEAAKEGLPVRMPRFFNLVLTQDRLVIMQADPKARNVTIIDSFDREQFAVELLKTGRTTRFTLIAPNGREMRMRMTAAGLGKTNADVLAAISAAGRQVTPAA